MAFPPFRFFIDAIHAGCAEAKCVGRFFAPCPCDAIRAGCAEAKEFGFDEGRRGRRDAIRAGCAEAKIVPPVDIPIQQDAIRAGYAEAKLILQFNVYNPV